MRTLFVALSLFAVTACFEPVGDGTAAPSRAGSDAGPDAGAPDAGSALPDAGPVLYGYAKPDCAPNDGPAWRFVLSDVPLTCDTVVGEGYYVWLWTGTLEARGYSIGPSTEGSACQCGALGDTARSGTVTLQSVSDAVIEGRIDAQFLGGTRHDAFRLVVCPGVRQCG